MWIEKGRKIQFRFLKSNPIGDWSLAGVQLKFTAADVSGEGVIRNIWADDPTGQKNLRFNVELSDGTFVVVPATGVLAVLD